MRLRLPQAGIFWLALAFCVVMPVTGQSLQKSGRPLPGSPNVDLPTYPSLEAYLQGRTSSPEALRAAATVTGLAPLTPIPVRGALPAAAKAPGVSLRQAGADEADLHIQRSGNGTVRWMRAEGTDAMALPSAGKNAALEAYVAVAADFARSRAAWLGLDRPEDELQVLDARRDDLGYTHVRFAQHYEGVPVWGRDLYMHFDATGALYALNGAYEPTPRGLANTPALSADAAETRVVDDLKGRGRWAPVQGNLVSKLGLDRVERRLVIYPDPERGMRLAYEISLHPNLLEWYAYLVDAHTGEVLNRIAQHCSYLQHDTPPPATPATLHLPENTAMNAASFVDGQGTDLAGVNQSFRVLQMDDGNFLKLWDLKNLPAGNLNVPVPDLGGSVILTANNQDLSENVELFALTSPNNAWTDRAGVSAHVNAKIVFDYYDATFSRRAIDNNDQSLISIIHATEGGQPMDNAYWNGRVMVYGDGQQAFTPLAEALDVAAHEMTHGVIQHTAGLVYQFQAGALNESFADIFGVLNDTEDFFLGEDIAVANFGIALRDLLNPDNAQVISQQPAHMAQYRNLTIDQDNGGVHINSGIPNRAAALVMQALGFQRAEQIYYRTLTQYLTRNSQFGDVRVAAEQAATDLYGAGSAELAAVQQAYDAVGILSTTGTGGGGGNDIPPVSGGTSYIAFMLEAGSVGLVDVTNPGNVTAGLFGDQVLARSNPERGDYAQLSTDRAGGQVWFINNENKLAFVDVNTGELAVFNDLFLQEAGDLWNASISPDGNFVALVSAYLVDPNIYIFDGSELAQIELKPESTQEGIQVESIQYPDVVSWSPNPEIPRIAFDAFNEQLLYDYWNIYEIDFAAQRIYELLPPLGNTIDIGNITYGNADPDLVAFNVLEEGGTPEIIVADYEQGSVFELGLADQGITRGLRPSFSPDDGFLVFSNSDASTLVITDGENFNPLEFDVPLLNPRWFATGGSAGQQNQAPTAGFSLDALSGTVPLTVNFDASASSDPNGDALSFRWEFGDGSTNGSVAPTHTFAQVGTFTVRLTVLDSGGLSSVAEVDIQVAPSSVPVEDDAVLPTRVALRQNYPNPFNPTTTIGFELPASSQATVRVMDLLGREVAVLADGVLPAGRHEVVFDAGDRPSGIYLITLEAAGVKETRHMVLLR